MAEDFHYVEDVFGFVVFHGGFPVAECVECDVFDSWVVEFCSDSFALSLEYSSLVSYVSWEDFF